MNAQVLLDHFESITQSEDSIPRLRKFILDLAVRGKLVRQDSSEEPAAEQLKRIALAQSQLGRIERSRPTRAEHGNNTVPQTLPLGWAKTQLSDLVTVINGRAYSRNELLESGTPILRVGNLFTSKHWYYSDLVLDADKYCDEGDLIFAWSASFGPFIWPGPKVIYHYHIWKLALHSEIELRKDYLYWLLMQRTQEIKEAGHGVSMIHMTKEKMEKLSVALPPASEQKRIVDQVTRLMKLCDELESCVHECNQLKGSLLEATLHSALV